MCNYSQGVEEKGTIAGMEKKLIQLVCRKLQKGKSVEAISDDLEETITEIQRICDAAEEYAPEYECEKIYKRLQELKSR